MREWVQDADIPNMTPCGNMTGHVLLVGGPVPWADTVFDLRAERLPFPTALPDRDEERSSAGHGWTFDSYAVGHNPDKPKGRNYTVVVFTDPDGFRFALAATSPSAPHVPSPTAVGNFAPVTDTLLRRGHMGVAPQGLDTFTTMTTFEKWRDAAKDPIAWLGRPEFATVEDISPALARGICRWASSGIRSGAYPFEFLQAGHHPVTARDWTAAGYSYEQAAQWMAHPAFHAADGPETARFYDERGIDAEEAACWLDLGLHESFLWAEQWPEFGSYGAYPGWLTIWQDTGWTPADVERLGMLHAERLGRTASYDRWQSLFYEESPALFMDWAVVAPQAAFETFRTNRTLDETVAHENAHKAAATPAALGDLAALREHPERLSPTTVAALLDAARIALTEADPSSATYAAIMRALKTTTTHTS